MRVVIIGGVAGGASAAARARRLSEQAEIILIERGANVSFANCGMPYYIGQTIENRDKLLVTTVERMQQRYAVDVRVRTEATAIDRERKVVALRDLDSERTEELAYDKLILSPGASPIRPPIPGADLPGIYTLRDLGDMDRIKDAIDHASSAAIIGGGFIGLEMAENLVHRGIRTTLIERLDQVLPPLDKELTQPILNALAERNVDVRLSTTAQGFESTAAGLMVQLDVGGQIPVDVVIMSVGVRPENQLAQAAGLEIGPRGGIVVNERMQTTDPDIYAVGDAVQVTDFVTGQPTQVPLAGPANRQGRIAADHIFGRDARFRGVQGTAVVGLFGVTAALTGASEKTLQRIERDYRKVYVHPADHASYYPGAETMTLKLLFAPEDGRILGAQAVGGDGVDKRIDVLAMAIQGGMTVYDLEEAELCYAPQFGSAKDPVNMAGFVAAGLLRGDHPQTPPEVTPPEGMFVLDVRTPAEFEAGSLPGAVNVPVDELRDRLGEVPRDQPVLAYCKVGMRGYLATRILQQQGYDARNLSGGYTSYQQTHAE